VPNVKKTGKKKSENLTFVPSPVETAIREMRLAELGGKDLADGDAAGEDERPAGERELTAGEERTRERERERCGPVETAPVKKECRRERERGGRGNVQLLLKKHFTQFEKRLGGGSEDFGQGARDVCLPLICLRYYRDVPAVIIYTYTR
jgi:hypothetical protein